MHKPFISIIVPVFNAALTLRECLESIKNIDYPKDKIEIIVVDNGSTDKSINIANQFEVKVLYENLIKGSYAARNKGIIEATGDLIAFTDADCIVTPQWLNHLVKYWKDLSFGCFAGEIEAYQPISLIEKFSDREGILKQGGTLTCPYLPYTQTANSAYRKEVFEKIGLFNPQMLSGGDADLSWRMQKERGLKIKFIPEALIYHKHRNTLIGLFRQFKKYEHGKLLWKHYYPDYELPTVQQRKKEVLDSFKDTFFYSYKNLVKFIKKDIDFIDFISPFLKLTMHLGTYMARCKF